ncbi:hypothetical protein AAMO2058_001641500 [Amorphochlora amoebiformis]
MEEAIEERKRREDENGLGQELEIGKKGPTWNPGNVTGGDFKRKDVDFGVPTGSEIEGSEFTRTDELALKACLSQTPEEERDTLGLASNVTDAGTFDDWTLSPVRSKEVKSSPKQLLSATDTSNCVSFKLDDTERSPEFCETFSKVEKTLGVTDLDRKTMTSQLKQLREKFGSSNTIYGVLEDEIDPRPDALRNSEVFLNGRRLEQIELAKAQTQNNEHFWENARMRRQLQEMARTAEENLEKFVKTDDALNNQREICSALRKEMKDMKAQLEEICDCLKKKETKEKELVEKLQAQERRNEILEKENAELLQRIKSHESTNSSGEVKRRDDLDGSNCGIRRRLQSVDRRLQILKLNNRRVHEKLNQWSVPGDSKALMNSALSLSSSSPPVPQHSRRESEDSEKQAPFEQTPSAEMKSQLEKGIVPDSTLNKALLNDVRLDSFQGSDGNKTKPEVAEDFMTPSMLERLRGASVEENLEGRPERSDTGPAEGILCAGDMTRSSVSRHQSAVRRFEDSTQEITPTCNVGVRAAFMGSPGGCAIM